MFKKIIGFVLILIIFFFAIKALVLLPYFTNLIVGKGKSPFQVGTDYVAQASKIYSVDSFQNQAGYTYGGQAQVVQNNLIGKVTLEKIAGKLIMSVENANPKANLNIWLTNRATVDDQTVYIDFGPLYKSLSIRQYVVDMRGEDISFEQYSHVLLVDQNNTVYAHIPLQ